MGERVFASGATRNSAEGKGRYDLVPPCLIRRLAHRYELGAKEHGEENWKLGMPKGVIIDSMLRHINQYREGDQSEDHLAAAAWGLAALMWFDENGWIETEEDKNKTTKEKIK